MNPEPVELSRDLVIVGLPLHTDPRRAGQDIPAHWQRFMQQGVAARISIRPDDLNVYCVYCDYESDYRAPYTMVLGHAVDASAEVPEGLRRVRVPAGKYAQFVFRGDPSRVITATWDDANQNWSSGVARRYIADFERYRPDAMTPTSVDGVIWIGVA